MPRETVPTSVNEWGSETHPAFGQVQVSRLSYGPPGAVLFDSDIKHQHTIRITVSAADRKRDLHHDWIHGGSKPLIEFELSEAQWASMVSSIGSSGVPCTIRATETDWNVPDLPYDPRLAHSMAEVKGAVHRLVEDARTAMAEYDALDPKAPAKVRREALGKVRRAIEYMEGSASFAAKSLNEHSENVVQRARADVEAFVINKLAQQGLNAGEVGPVIELPMLPVGEE